MIKTTFWSPDTCGCIVSFIYRTDVPAEVREHRLKDVVRICPEHPGLTGLFLYSAITDENRRKNTAQGIARALDPNLRAKVFQWAFDANRVLEISFLVVVTPVTKQQLQQEYDIQFGPGRVVVL